MKLLRTLLLLTVLVGVFLQAGPVQAAPLEERGLLLPFGDGILGIGILDLDKLLGIASPEEGGLPLLPFIGNILELLHLGELVVGLIKGLNYLKTPLGNLVLDLLYPISTLKLDQILETVFDLGDIINILPDEHTLIAINLGIIGIKIDLDPDELLNIRAINISTPFLSAEVTTDLEAKIQAGGETVMFEVGDVVDLAGNIIGLAFGRMDAKYVPEEKRVVGDMTQVLGGGQKAVRQSQLYNKQGRANMVVGASQRAAGKPTLYNRIGRHKGIDSRTTFDFPRDLLIELNSEDEGILSAANSFSSRLKNAPLDRGIKGLLDVFWNIKGKTRKADPFNATMSWRVDKRLVEKLQELISQAVELQDLLFVYYDEQKDRWVKPDQNSVVDTKEGIVTHVTTHFSYWSVGVKQTGKAQAPSYQKGARDYSPGNQKAGAATVAPTFGVLAFVALLAALLF